LYKALSVDGQENKFQSLLHFVISGVSSNISTTRQTLDEICNSANGNFCFCFHSSTFAAEKKFLIKLAKPGFIFALIY